jgi:prepilin-type N-terminal cleavage/methylation domain-containing protein
VIRRPRSLADRGFTLVEVLVALLVIALGLAALMVAVQGAARTSGYLRDKTLAQWIALNRIAEVRLTLNKPGTPTNVPTNVPATVPANASTSVPASASTSVPTSAQSNDTGQLDFANRTWHYDTRYFNTTYPGMKRIVVRVWAGDAKTKGNPITESTSFLGASIGQPGASNTDWTVGSTAASALPCGQQVGGAQVGGAQVGGAQVGAIGAGATTTGTPGVNCTPAPGVPGVTPTITPTIGTPGVTLP